MRLARTFSWLSIALVSCGPSAPAEPDAGGAQLEPIKAYREVEVGTRVEYQEASIDYSCRRLATQPTPGDPVEVTFQLRDFQEGFPVDDTDVWLFSNNVIADECNPPSCQSFTTDRDGNATVQLPANGWYAYRVHPKMGLSAMSTVFAVFQYNEPAPPAAGQAVVGNSVSKATIELIPSLLGINRTDGRALVAGRIQDCAGNYVQNAIVRLYDPNGELVETGPDGPFIHYFNGEADNSLPDLDATVSSEDGLYVAIEVPVLSDEPYRVEAWGMLDGRLTLLGCEAARIFEDAVTILNMTPVRADGPEGCPAE